MENVIIQFGNWVVIESGLKRTVNPSYEVGSYDIWKTREINQELYWDWLLHMTEKTWMSEEELQDFSMALLFAQDFFKIKESKYVNDNVSLSKTLYLQKQYKENHDKVSKIKSPESGLSMPPDDLTSAYQKKIQDVISPITYLELPS